MAARRLLAPALTSLTAVEAVWPYAARLHVCDGRERIGLVLDTRLKRPRPPPATSYAFDAADRFVGAFPTRKLAVAAVCARHDDELARAADTRVAA